MIATLTRQASEAGVPVMIVSGDRDVYQLVGDGVRVMTTSRGVTDTKVYDHDGVIERYGVPPDLVTDFIGLKGDSSDNIPGVPGIGDKTAAQLLQQYGSLEKVLESVDEIAGAKRKQNLTEHADDARVSKQLATMVVDVDVPIAVTEELRAVPDRSKLRDAANEFELRAVIQRLDEEWDEVVPGRMVEETIEVEAEEGSPADLAEGAISVAIVAGRWAASDGERVVAGDATDLAALAEQLRERPLIAHDTKSLGGDGPESLLAAAGPQGLDLAHDTMVAAYLIDPARRTYDLHELAADAGLAAAPAGVEEGQMSLAAEEGDVAGDPAVGRTPRGRAGAAPAPAADRVRGRATPERGRDAVDRGLGRDGADRPWARHRATRRDRRRNGGPDRRARARDLRARRRTSSRSAPRSSSRRCSSTSSG